MGLMDNMKDKMSGMSDEMKGRYLELKGKAKRGELDDKGRDELEKLRKMFTKK